jgi:hypothetical protein
MMERQGVGPHPATLSADAHAIERGGAEASASAAAANSCKARKAARMRSNARSDKGSSFSLPPASATGLGGGGGELQYQVPTALLNFCTVFVPPPPRPPRRLKSRASATQVNSAECAQRFKRVSAALALSAGFSLSRGSC